YPNVNSLAEEHLPKNREGARAEHRFCAVTKAEVTCALCPFPVLVKTGDVQNNPRTIIPTAAGKSLVSFASTSLQPVLEGVHELGKDASANGAPKSIEVEVAARSTGTVYSAKPPPEQTALGKLGFDKVGKKRQCVSEGKKERCCLWMDRKSDHFQIRGTQSEQ
ncbi:VPS10 domain-containing receptor SorCS3, partial [Tachysurus ichikawai]